MKIEYDGKLIEVDLLFDFSFNERQYVACSYIDSLGNCKIIVMQTEKNGEKFEVKPIPSDEKDMVLEVFNELKRQMLEGELDGEC